MGQLDNLIKEINRQAKDNIAFKGLPHVRMKKIPFSSPRANYMLYGGIPRGRIIEFSGDEGSGKTTSALDLVGQAQRMFRREYDTELNDLQSRDKLNKEQSTRLVQLESVGSKRIVYVDCENTLDTEWAEKLRVDVDNLILLKPQAQSAEEIFQMVDEMVETGEVGMVVIDSLGVMVSQQALEKSIEDKTYGGISTALTKFTNVITPKLSKYDCTIICINQMREDLSASYVSYRTPGGKSFKHGCSVRIMFRKGDYINEEGREVRRGVDNPAGNFVDMKILKTKSCKPDRLNGFYTLRYETGVDIIADLVEVAIKYNLMTQNGSWYQLVDGETGEIIEDENGEPLKVQGKAGLINLFKENETLLEELKGLIAKKVSD